MFGLFSLQYQNITDKFKLKVLNNQLLIDINKLNYRIDQHEERLSRLRLQADLLDNVLNVDKKHQVRIKILQQIIKQDNINLKLTEINQIATEVSFNSEKYDLNPALVLAIIKQESAFKIHAVSLAGAQGLMQILPTTGMDIKQWLGFKYYSPFKISHNIEFGCFYLAKLLHDYQFDISNAIMAYNAGPNAVKKYLANEIKKLPDETIDYEHKVLTYYTYYEKLGVK
jgi:soluble lytic murein transglycosylase-like protein